MAELIKSVKALGEAITGEKIEGDTLFEAVKDAGEKMTGKKLEGKGLNDVIAETAEEYQGGGGSVIVDALPAQGVEGTTYLLRKKKESEVFKAHAYAFLYSKVELPFLNLVFIDADFNALKKSIETKLDPSLNPDVDFSEISNLNADSVSSVDWEDFIENRNVVMVTTEEEVLNIAEDVDCIIQDLGEIGIENLGYLEYDMDGEWLAGMYTWLNTFTHHTIKQNDKMVEGNREVIYNSELEPGQTLYSFAEWQDEITDTVVGTLTDTYEYDRDTLMNLGEGDCYFITLTPEVPEVTYSYTEYVFDQGVYTLIGGGAGGNLYNILVTTEGHYYGSCSFTMQVDIDTLQNGNDLMQYLKDKGFYESEGYYPIVGTAHKTSGGDEVGRIFGLRATIGEEADIFWGLSTQANDFYNGAFLIGEPEYITIEYI